MGTFGKEMLRTLVMVFIFSVYFGWSYLLTSYIGFSWLKPFPFLFDSFLYLYVFVAVSSFIPLGLCYFLLEIKRKKRTLFYQLLPIHFFLFAGLIGLTFT